MPGIQKHYKRQVTVVYAKLTLSTNIICTEIPRHVPPYEINLVKLKFWCMPFCHHINNKKLVISYFLPPKNYLAVQLLRTKDRKRAWMTFMCYIFEDEVSEINASALVFKKLQRFQQELCATLNQWQWHRGQKKKKATPATSVLSVRPVHVESILFHTEFL